MRTAVRKETNLTVPGTSTKAVEQAAGVATCCKRCGAESTFEELSAGRCSKCGALLKSNRESVKHGLFGREMRALLMEQASALRERTTAIETDLGGEDNLSTIVRDLIGRYVETSAIANALGRRLLIEQPVTGKGRTRAILSAYLSAVDRQFRIGTALGLERRSKPVPSARAWLESLHTTPDPDQPPDDADPE